MSGIHHRKIYLTTMDRLLRTRDQTHTLNNTHRGTHPNTHTSCYFLVQAKCCSSCPGLLLVIYVDASHGIINGSKVIRHEKEYHFLNDPKKTMMDGHHEGTKNVVEGGCKDGGVPVLPACLSNVQKGEIKLMA